MNYLHFHSIYVCLILPKATTIFLRVQRCKLWKLGSQARTGSKNAQGDMEYNVGYIM